MHRIASPAMTSGPKHKKHKTKYSLPHPPTCRRPPPPEREATESSRQSRNEITRAASTVLSLAYIYACMDKRNGMTAPGSVFFRFEAIV
jgi:hypothetical protein